MLDGFTFSEALSFLAISSAVVIAALIKMTNKSERKRKPFKIQTYFFLFIFCILGVVLYPLYEGPFSDTFWFLPEFVLELFYDFLICALIFGVVYIEEYHFQYWRAITFGLTLLIFSLGLEYFQMALLSIALIFILPIILSRILKRMKSVQSISSLQLERRMVKQEARPKTADEILKEDALKMRKK